jgi:hypothetical protein
MLATLQQLKDRLGITDAGQDAQLTTLLQSASDKVLDLCGYKEADTPGIVELLRNVQQGREVRTGYRNEIASTTFLVEGRGHGTAFSTLASDLLDPDDGVFLVLGSAEWWPPNFVEERRPRFRKWREPVWPVVRVTYDVIGIGTGANAPQPLQQAALRLASFWLSLEQAGATAEARVGQIEQEMSEMPVPQDLRSILGRHYRGRGVVATWVS